MKRIIMKRLANNGYGLIFVVLISTLALLMIASCGGGGGGGDGDPDNPPSPPSPELSLIINSVEVDECPNVKVYLSIMDEDKQVVEDDPALAVKLYEDGIEQTNNFSIVWQGDIQAPITIVFAMDYSLSMSTKSVTDMENGVKAFVDEMRPEDKAAIIKFYNAPQLMVGLTSDKTALYNAVDQAPDSRQYTNIYDTVYEAVNVVAGSEGRLAVILLTDGEHLVSDDYTVDHTLQEAIDNAKQHEVPVFSIALGLRDDSEIKQISEETGGIYFPILDSDAINDVYLSLFALLGKQHLIIYTSSAADDVEHSLQISAELNGTTGDSIIENFLLCPAGP
ncbi:MAG: VWA domain-containing protein [Desulfobacteraceae bacterium]|nr:VWA domain-containing protein [Desulfobacteraceae bacterium]